MDDIERRLSTFQECPFVSLGEPIKFAQAGLYYCIKTNAIKCAYCEVVITNWSKDDDPDRIHEKDFPLCPFVQTEIVPRLARLKMQKVLQESNAIILDENYYKDLNNIGLILHVSAQYSQYCLYTERLKTFENWPKYLLPKPEALAEAGFYYKGRGDEVCCFHCGGGVKQWEPSDDPWTEHAKFYSQCNYVVLNKEEDFINKAIEKASTATSTATVAPVVDGCQGVKESVANASCKDSQEKSKTYSEILEENRTLKDSRLCKVCVDRDASVVILPCRHLAVCVECVVNLKDCPVCRKSIQILIKTYL